MLSCIRKITAVCQSSHASPTCPAHENSIHRLKIYKHRVPTSEHRARALGRPECEYITLRGQDAELLSVQPSCTCTALTINV